MSKGRPRIEVRLDIDVKEAVEAHLTSPLAGGVPFGAISDWCGEAISFRVHCVEVELAGGRLWCDPLVWQAIKTQIPGMEKVATPGIDASKDF